VSKKPKYFNEKLTNEDRKILDQAARKLVIKFYSLQEKYSDSKYIAKILKKLQSPRNSSYLYALMYANISPVGETFQPQTVNRRLLSDMRSTIEPEHIDVLEKEHPGLLLHPRDLRERVLKILQDEGVIQHLEEEGEIRGQKRKKRLRGKPKQYVANRGGRLSEYKVSERIDKLKKTIEKRGAMEYFVHALNETGIIEKLIENNILLFIRAARTLDEVAYQRWMGSAHVFLYDSIEEACSECKEDLKTGLQYLKAKREDQLQQEAHYAAQTAIKSLDYPYLLLFLTTLFEL